jgi:hypothetical protein
MFVFVCLFVLFCAGRGRCDGLITHSKESYRVSIRLRNLIKRFYVPQWELKELRERELRTTAISIHSIGVREFALKQGQ